MAENSTFKRLRDTLASIVESQRRFGDPQRRTLAIIVSILIAFLLWFTFSLREQYTVVVEMPIEIGRLPEGRALVEPPPTMARVTMQGVGAELLWLRRSPPTLVVHASTDQVDMYAAASENPRLPSGLSVQSVSPSAIQLALEPEVARRVPVLLVHDLDPAPDHDLLEAPTISPDSVQVIGARSLVLPMTSFPTVPFEAGGFRDSFTARVPLADTLAGLVRTNLSAVDVSVEVGTFTEGRRTIEVHIEDLPEGVIVTPTPARLQATFRVPLEHYQRAMRTPDFYAFIPYEAVLADTTGTLMAFVQPPANLIVRDISVEPRQVRYWVRLD